MKPNPDGIEKVEQTGSCSDERRNDEVCTAPYEQYADSWQWTRN